MVRCGVYYVDKAKRPENWPLLLSELREIGIAPELVYSQESALNILEGLCTKYHGAIVLKLNGNLYAMPNIRLKIIIHENGTGESGQKKVDDTTLNRLVAKKLDAREHRIVITSKKGFENFSKDLFRGKIHIPKPRWVKKLMTLGIGGVIVAPMIYFNILPSHPTHSTGTSLLMKLTEKVITIGVLLLLARRKGYLK